MASVDAGILLESGTNELEIVEFRIGNEWYGINVTKVREIVNPLPVTQLPMQHDFIHGIIHLRGRVIPLVDLPQVVGDQTAPSKENKYIITEFNNHHTAFRVHEVSRIYRLGWNQVEKPNDMLSGKDGIATGLIKFEDRITILLDYEKIVIDIAPNLGIQKKEVDSSLAHLRAGKNILIAEDSATLRQLLLDCLNEAGYNSTIILNDGLQAWQHLETMAKSHKDKISQHIHLVISDIEMPQMDGLHLTKRIKENEFLGVLPVIIFSSLINDDIRHKGESVGANAQVSKPEIAKLVGLIDKYVGIV